MLKITILGDEFYDERSEEFVTRGDVELELEHSLVSLSKWESKWEKPFLVSANKTDEETYDYIRMMILTPDVSEEIFARLSTKNLEEINDYIGAKMTATWFREIPGEKKSSETITAELIYYWMITWNIPFECQHWHLNKLFTLIQVCSRKNAPPKKMNARELAERNRRLNAERKARLNTRG